jgi:queuine tRNA-ribosyltransferase
VGPRQGLHGRAYLRHLCKAGEITGLRLNTLHNLTYYQDLMAGLRVAIETQSLDAFAGHFYAERGETPEAVP